MDIYVENNIYNPKVAPAEGDTILSSLLVKEYVLYRVINRTIYVHLTHHYMNETEVNVNNYYGFQSMFNHDYYIMTPDGLYTDFTKTTDVIKFNKTDYPDFNRFIETNNTKTIFQHVHLFDYKNGSHDLIDNLIFSYSSKKCYHKIIQNKNMSKGNVIEIAGTYCWFEPYVNDDYLLIYSSDINEYTYLYIDVKQAISNHRVRCPYNFIGRSYEIIDNKHNISISNDDNMMFFHLYLTSSEPGTLLLKFKSILI